MSPWTIECDDRRGRHLVAVQRHGAGKQVLSQEPYAAVLYDDQQSQLCDHTTKAVPELKRCAGCKLVWYSSKAAQRAAWRSHKQECAALARVAPRVPPATVRLAARVLWRAESEAQGGQLPAEEAARGRLGGGTFAEVQQLEHHWDELSDERKTTFAQMAMLTRLYMYGQVDADVGVPAKDIAQLLATFACNNHTICNTELQPLGIGLYPTGAMVNHNCRPNAVQSFVGAAIVFRAVRAIPPGEEVTISYTDLKATRPERRAFLLRHYHFDVDAGTAAAAEQQPADVHLSSQAPGIAASVSRQPPGPLDAVDQQLTALRTPGAFMLSEAVQTDGDRTPGISFSGDGAAPPPGSSTLARVRCWGVAFFRGDGGTHSSRAAAAGSGAEHSSGRSSAAAGSSSGAAAGMSGEPTEEVHMQLARAGTDAAVQALEAISAGEERMSAGEPGTAVSHLQAALASTGRTLVPSHGLQLRLRDLLMRAAVQAQQWELMLQTARQLLPAYSLIYPQPWPDLGLLHAHIAKAAAVVERDDEAATAAEAAASILRITNGDCDVVQDMLRLRHDIEANRHRACGSD